MSTSLGVEQQMLHAYVALENLGRGRPLNDIAEELGLSRFAVSRMVRRARELGLVEVTVRTDDPLDVDLSGRLVERFGLRSAFVVHAPVGSAEAVRDAVARIAARYLEENVVEDDVLGIAPGRTLVAASRLLQRLPWVDVVQLTGVGAGRIEDGVEAITNAGRVARGGIHPLYAPFITDGPAAPLLQHPAVQQTVRRFDYVTKAVMTIGGWPGSSLLADHLHQLGERDALIERGVVAEVGAVLLDREGRVVDALGDRLIGISVDRLRRVPTKIVVGGGEGKADAVRAVVRSGLCDVLVTDVQSAQVALRDG
ncbi:sugar-binding transcriptional regulator [Microbacterium sp. Marseille-Q6965]|uniref:sugar-binding transcriptional regulator n=1 Tax=Microbacterium sp. Marseille-Q6965 TaxID=2965072 RepID=UPI0021B72037|nr:sugar-binding domain-containing protein [Microbacterium sp. Marseille-Q6965]